MTAIVGVDIGGTKISATLVNHNGEPIATTRVPTDASGPAGVYASTRLALERLALERSISAFDAIGVGIAGVVDNRRGTVAHAVNLSIDGDPFAIGPLLEKDFGAAVQIENDVNAGALGAFVQMSARERISDLAYLAIGTGIAAGVVLNGRLHRGRRGIAGEIGHLPVVWNGPRCECGLRGCLEAVASGRAVDRAWPVEPGRSSFAELLAAARHLETAAALVHEITDYLAHAILLIAVAYDVDRIVLGGGVAQVGPPLSEAIGAAVGRLDSQSAFVRALGLSRRLTPVPRGPIVAIGAAAAVVERLTLDEPPSPTSGDPTAGAGP